MAVEKNTSVLSTLTDTQKKDFKFLIQLASEHEESNVELAQALMKLAEKIRPKAPMVQHKLLIYKRKINQQNRQKKQAPKLSRAHAATPNKKKTYNFKQWLTAPITFFVLVPWLLFAVYTVFLATPKFESQAQLIVKQPDGGSTLDASMALLSGFTGQSTSSDPQLVKAYIHSQDMLDHIEQELALFEHASDDNIDFVSRLDRDASREDFMEFYLNSVAVYIDDASSVITISVQGFGAEYTRALTNAIVERAEWYINSIGHHLANEQLKFVQGEHALVEKRLSSAQSALLQFQQQYNLLDPLAEGTAMQQIAYGLEAQIATKEAELKSLRAVMSNNAPQVMATKSALDGLKAQLLAERSRLATKKDDMSVSDILSKFTDLKIDMDLALQAYTGSQVSLEKSRIEAYRQLKYLIVVESPTLPDDAKYPNVEYNLLLAAVILLLVFGIGKIIIATIRELG